MPMKISLTSRFILAGTALGLALPMAATLLLLWHRNEPCTLATVLFLHRNDPLLLLIDTAPLITTTLALILGTQYSQLRLSAARQKRHLQTMEGINRSIRRFVPGEFLRLLNHSSITNIRLGDNTMREMTVLFSDIRGFAGLSEQLTPDENFRFLNSYLKRMEPAIHAHNGFIDKFVGDSIMALFHTPEDAIKAALAMFEALELYNRHRRSSGYIPIDLGMGINSGPLMLGTIGGRDRMEGTVIGDSVNTAARIERLTRVYKARLLVSEQTLNKLKKPPHDHCRFIDRVVVRGRMQPVTIHEIIDVDPPTVREAKLAILGRYENAVDLFQKKRYADAYPLFRECRAVYTGGRVCAIYMERIEELQQEHACTGPAG